VSIIKSQLNALILAKRFKKQLRVSLWLCLLCLPHMRNAHTWKTFKTSYLLAIHKTVKR